MLRAIFTVGLLGALTMLGAGCAQQSLDHAGEPSKPALASKQATQGGAEDSAKTKQVTLEVTGMT